MVVLGGGGFLISEVPLYAAAAIERRGKNLKGVKVVYLEAKTNI